MLGVTYETDVEATMRDGTVLRADVWRPSGRGRFPTLLMRTPYGKQGAQDTVFAHPHWWAQRGYAVVVQDTRGRGASDGVFTVLMEGDDTVDTILWAAELPYSNGRVGTYGFSYPGTLQLQGAVRQPEPLKAIAPAMAQGDPYDGWVFNNGAFALAFNASWATFMGQEMARRRGDAALELHLMKQLGALPSQYLTLPLTDIPNFDIDGVGDFFLEWLEHQRRDEYWDDREVVSQLSATRCPAFVVAGLWDVFLEGSLDVFAELDRATEQPHVNELVLGPWYHQPWGRIVGGTNYGPTADNIVSESQLRFFDQWLRDGEELDEPTVRWYVTGANRWEKTNSWPPPSDSLQMFLRSDGRANSLSGNGFLALEPPDSEPPDVFTYDPAVPVPSLGGRSCCVDGIAPMGPTDQRPVEVMNQVLVYTSPPLDDPRLVAGRIEAQIFAASSAADTDWTIKICDVHPDGRSVNVQEAIQRARFAASDRHPELVPPGQPTEFNFEVGTCAHLFEAGHAIRVEISSSNFPQWDRNLNTGNPAGTDTISDRVVATQFVLHEAGSASKITLPVLDL